MEGPGPAGIWRDVDPWAGASYEDLAISELTTEKTLPQRFIRNQPAQHRARRGFAPYGQVMPDLATVVAANVRAERARRTWHQSTLAELLGWSVGMVSETENDKRQVALNDLPNLCRAFEVPLADMLRGADRADLDALGL